jgi:hypothetical protein
MKAGDLVKFIAPGCDSVGVVIGESPYDWMLADAVQVLWGSGELVERVPPRILEVIQCLPIDAGGNQ